MNVPGFDLPAQIKSIRPELDAAIARTLDSCAFCMGPEVTNFEEAFAKYVGTPHCLGFNSGTSALHVAMRLLDVGPGDEVITTPYTFIATSWAIVYTGAKPVYVDIEKETMNLDPKLLEKAITPKTKAVMPVDLYGHPFDADPILEICRRHNLPLVEDAAQAVGASYKGRSAGTLGEMAGFSFYPGKNLGACGEGGALVTSSAKHAKRGAALREHGASTRYYHEEVGYNYRMEGIQGAVLGVKLRHLPAWTAARRRIAHTYHKLLAPTPLVLPLEAPGVESVYHQYVVRHPSRDELRDHLQSKGIGTALHYPLPLHLQKCFADLGHKAGDFPVSEAAAHECLSLPMYPELSDQQVEYVAAMIREFPLW
jgi:dTDP-4-amino-4,6-dideoxygalactose transaminase